MPPRAPGISPCSARSAPLSPVSTAISSHSTTPLSSAIFAASSPRLNEGSSSSVVNPSAEDDPMRVMIVADMEGVCGIQSWEHVGGRGVPLYEEGRRLYTEEINAAVRGCK